MSDVQNSVNSEIIENENENEILRQRKEKLQRLREEEGYDPYVVEKWDRKDTILSIRERFDHVQPDETLRDTVLCTAGRLMTVRRQGKATFADLADEDNRIQLYCQFNELGEKSYDFLKKWVDSGDWVGVIGHPCRP